MPLFKSQNRKYWESAREDIPQLRQAIDETLMKYHIDFEKWLTNMDCLDRWSEYDSDGQCAQGGVSSIIYRFKRWDMPLGIEDWFLAGFPDVWLWMIDHTELFSEFDDVEDDPRYFAGDKMLPAAYNLIIEMRIKKTGLHPALANYDVF